MAPTAIHHGRSYEGLVAIRVIVLLGTGLLITSALSSSAGSGTLACERNEDRSAQTWEALRRSLGMFQRPASLKDYVSYESTEALSRHFYSRGTVLAAQGRVEEAMAAFERAAAIDPTDAAHWNNVGVAAMRHHEDKIYYRALPSLERALLRDPENRLVAANLQLVSAVTQLRDEGSWGGNLGAPQPAQSPPGRVWCQDDDTAVFQLSKGKYQRCSVAAVAAKHFDSSDRGVAAAKAVCVACPAACGLCPAPAAWVAEWWSTSNNNGPDDNGGSDSNGRNDAGASNHTGGGAGSVNSEDSGVDHAPCTIERRSAASLTPAEFARKYSMRRVPVLLSGIADHWPIQRWLRRAKTLPPDVNCESHDSDAQLGAWLRDSLHSADKLSRNQYVNLDRFGSGGDPNTSGGKGGAAGASLSVLPLVRAVAATGYTPDILFGGPADGIGPSGTAETTRNASSGPGDLLKRACYADLPRRWLLLSGKDTGSAWHVDPLNTSAWNTLLIGHKRWALLPPKAVPNDIHVEGRHAYVLQDKDSTSLRTPAIEYFNRSTAWGAEMGWWGTTAPWRDSSGTSASTTFDRLMKDASKPQTAQPRENNGLLECVQRPNETLFVPSGWWHTTLNLKPSLAVTENFAAEPNLDEVLAELAKRPNQTPGGRETATAHCLNELQWLIAAESAAESRRRHSGTDCGPEAVTATRYPGPGPSVRVGDSGSASTDATGQAVTCSQAHNQHTWPAAVRFGHNAPETHLILFLASKKDSVGAKSASAALRTAARRAVLQGSSPELVQIVEVQPSGQATRELMRQFGLTIGDSDQGRRPTVRIATARATLFRYSPPEEVTYALVDIMDKSNVSDGEVLDTQADVDSSDVESRLVQVLVSWLMEVQSEQAKPYLTAADRRVLLTLMEQEQK